MSTEPLKRKLAAILYADVAGYSRLTGEDEEGTHRALRAYLDAISSHIQNRNGRVVHYAGDAVLAEFGTVSEAVSCAVKVQSDIKSRNRDLPDDRKVQFRIGVNLGEVILDQEEIYGDGVNVAARLEALADPGGVCISDAVRTAVGKKLNLAYEDMGEREVKNIAEPVRAYRIRLEDEVALKPAPKRRSWTRWVVTAGAALVGLAVIASVNVWLKPWSPTLEPAPVEGTTIPLPEKPSIAVLPFTNMNANPEHEYFTDGLTDDLITDLSKISGLLVIARNSVFLYKEKSVGVQQVAQELGVRYVLEGSGRRAGGRVRINAQLIDATTGGHVWAERYDEPLADVFTLQDKVIRRIVSALEVKLTSQEQAATAGRGTENADAYDAFLKGWSHLLKKTAVDAIEAIAFFEQALELDPDYYDADAALAQTYWDYSSNEKFNIVVDPPLGASFPPSGYTTYLNAWKYLQKASVKPSSQVHTLASRMLQRQRRFDEAMEEAKQAVALGPNNPTAYDTLIENLIYAGEAEQALILIDESIGFDPNLPGEKLFLKGMSYYTQGRLEEAVSVIDKARGHNPNQTRYAAIQAGALAELGRLREAEVALESYLSEWTDSADLNWAMFHWPFQRMDTIERLADSFIKAGMRLPQRRYYLATKQNRLTTEQIRSLLSGKTMIGTNRGYFGIVDRSFAGITENAFAVTRDQNAQIVRQGDLNYFRTAGKTRIGDELLCDHWPDFLGEYCVAIYRNPLGSADAKDEYLFFTLMSTFSFAVFDSAS